VSPSQTKVPPPAQLTNVHVLILSTADWNRPLWTNKQFIARELARRTRVTYIESLGLRRPQLSVDDASRIAKRVTSWRRSRTAYEINGHQAAVNVVSPMVLPLHSNRAVRRLNRYAIRRCIAAWHQTPKAQRVLWSFSPITYGLETLATATVYHCVDLLAGFPGVNARAVDEGERSLATTEITAIASSSVVEKHLQDQGFTDIHLWENVAEISIFTAHAYDVREPNLVVFAGNLTEHKIDFALLDRIAKLDGIKLILSGTIADGGGGTGNLTRLLSHTNVDYVGSLKLADLAKLLGRATVGLVPYQLNDYTAGVFPMKVYEYLGAGLPIITTALPSLCHLASPDVVIARTPTEFVESTARFAGETPQPAAVSRRVETAKSHSWETRGVEAAALVEALVAPQAADPAIPRGVAHDD
jgi:teichuronic acid biosynthesis glycosyltransferase TuaH